MPEAPDVTRLLLDWRRGQPAALERLLPLVYSELKKIAHARMRAESPCGNTLQTTALVNEAYVRLVDGARIDWQSRAHFYAVCARLMRRILVDRARARRADKRGGDAHAIPFGDWIGAVPAKDETLLAIDEALQRLSASDARKARVVELRYFGGLTLEETAAALGTSAETVTRDWRVARMWLEHELRPKTPGSQSRPTRGKVS
jgi:RNA polymerase sigma factor (TIGR02999 family)